MDIQDWNDVAHIGNIVPALRLLEKEYSLPVFTRCHFVYAWHLADTRIVVGLNRVRTEIIFSRRSRIRIHSTTPMIESGLKSGDFFVTVPYEYRSLMIKILTDNQLYAKTLR